MSPINPPLHSAWSTTLALHVPSAQPHATRQGSKKERDQDAPGIGNLLGGGGGSGADGEEPRGIERIAGMGMCRGGMASMLRAAAAL